MLIVFLTLFFLLAEPVSAEYLVAEQSAQIKVSETDIVDKRNIILKKYLESKNSPLANFSEQIIYSSDKYELDWRLIPAITGVESGFGNHMPKNSYNAYGWANGAHSFNSWNESIEIVTKTLREKYKDRGAQSISQIGRIYAPPSSTWSYKVKGFMDDISEFPLDYTI